VEQEVTRDSIRFMWCGTYRLWWLVHIFCGYLEFIDAQIEFVPTMRRIRNFVGTISNRANLGNLKG